MTAPNSSVYSTPSKFHMRASEKTRRLTGLALMTAIIVVLQVVASFVKFGPFTITLALAPILIGAALYGPKAGACLGGVFGAVVLLACILGWDPVERSCGMPIPS